MPKKVTDKEILAAVAEQIARDGVASTLNLASKLNCGPSHIGFVAYENGYDVYGEAAFAITEKKK